MQEQQENYCLQDVVQCPTNARRPADITGCGATFSEAPDSEGLHDCPECGMWFSKEGTYAR